MMGGTNLLMQPLPQMVAESTYKSIVVRLGLGELPPSERVRHLVAIDTERVLSVIRPTDLLLPTLGGAAEVTNNHTYAEIYQGTAGPLNLPGRDWCQQVMVGDCHMDVRYYLARSKKSKKISRN